MKILNSRVCRVSFSLGLFIFSSLSFAQQTAPSVLPTEPQNCPKYNTNIRVISVKKNAPGKIEVEVEIENNSNNSIGFSMTRGDWAVLVDNTGTQWKLAAGQYSGGDRKHIPGVKMKRSHHFAVLVGGNDVTSVAFEIQYQISGTFDSCKFSARNLPVV